MPTSTDGLQTNARAGTVPQIGTETTPLAGTAADKSLPSMTIALATTADFIERKGEGRKFHNSVKQSTEGAAGSADGPGSYTEMLYPAESIFQKVTPTSLGSGAYQRLYWITPTAPDALQTYIVQKGNGRSGMNKQWRGVYWNGFTFTASKEEVAHSGDLMALGTTEFPDIMTASPTEIAQLDIDANEGDLYYSLVSLDDLNTNAIQVMRGFAFNFAVGGRTNQFRAINSASRGATGTVESTGLDVTLAVRLGAELNAPTGWQATHAYSLGQFVRRLTGSGLLVFKATAAGTSAGTEPTWPSTVGGTVVDGTVTWTAQLRDYSDPVSMAAMRNAAYIFWRYKAVGPLIGGGIYNTWQVDVATKINAAPGDEDENELLVNAWGLRVVPDPADASKRPFIIKSISPIATV